MFKVLDNRRLDILGLRPFSSSTFKNPTSSPDAGRDSFTSKMSVVSNPQNGTFVLKALYTLCEVGALTRYRLSDNGLQFFVSTQNTKG